MHEVYHLSAVMDPREVRHPTCILLTLYIMMKTIHLFLPPSDHYERFHGYLRSNEAH